ncbi:MAG: accessory factor UbiK family protein [Hyphomicrobiales bacterium]|jgi:BMFP domain-containing protein YqiC|nr:accessory factor UbiK family protein [Hyphomicrobiales bacterium]|tara:strand:+ start:584 stop:853 length:270 start_codon:yes stop_codon:yes gene_type:complete
MVESGSKLFNNLAELLSNTAGAASGVKKEIDVIVKSQVERLLNDFEVVQRDEFDAMKEMLIRERDKNDELEKKINNLEKLIKKQNKTIK